MPRAAATALTTCRRGEPGLNKAGPEMSPKRRTADSSAARSAGSFADTRARGAPCTAPWAAEKTPSPALRWLVWKWDRAPHAARQFPGKQGQRRAAARNENSVALGPELLSRSVSPSRHTKRAQPTARWRNPFPKSFPAQRNRNARPAQAAECDRVPDTILQDKTAPRPRASTP